MGFADQMRELPHTLLPRVAADQGGVLSGINVLIYDAADPLRLWVIQLIIIVMMTQLLALIFGRIRQPRVIAEVIGGVFLGPTVMGRIPNFRATIFPDAGMAMLTLTSTIALVFFLFLVGLEIDTRVMKRNIRASAAVSLAGLIIPLGLGAALGVGIYNKFIDPSVNFGYFILFTAVAVGITAFPVLCRILSETKLLDTPVGVVTLSAGVGNDVVGWILLALSVALVNAGDGLTALYVLLTSLAFVLLLLYPIRWGYAWLARRTGSIEKGSPTPMMMTLTLLMVLASAFFTDIIGVHAIFGGFLAGLVIPHENGYAISLVEKIEDFISLLLPIYFTLSGLKTNLGLLNDGITWGYTILICAVAFCSKFFACSAAAYGTGFNWRESAAIGSLMSCKGLVELIVLNIGLQAGILNQRVFSMFVVHALLLTFLTTPLTLLFYPPKHRLVTGRNNKAAKPPTDSTLEDGASDEKGGSSSPDSGDYTKTRFSLVLDKIEQVPSAMTLAQLIQPTASVSIDAYRLIELTTRTSAVLKSQEASSIIHSDPVLSILRTYGHLHNLPVSTALEIVPFVEFPTAVASHVRETNSQMVLIPWCHTADESSAYSGRDQFDAMFSEQTHSVVNAELIRNIFLHSMTDVALFVDRGVQKNSQQQHIFLPFFGGPDDRLALKFVAQLANNSNVSAVVLWIQPEEGYESAAVETVHHDTLNSPNAAQVRNDTVYGEHYDTHTRAASTTADSILWEQLSREAGTSSRIAYGTRLSSTPLRTAVETAQAELTILAGNKNLLVVLGRSKRLAALSHEAELKKIIRDRNASVAAVVPRTMGDIGAAFVAEKLNASLLVVQAELSS